MSHDLKEPLRSVSNYAELLERHYSGDERATEFTSIIIDGVKRANALIDSLLTYSRTRAPTRRTAIKLNSILQWALLNLEHAVRESGAQITSADLPEVVVDESQTIQLFQNLLSNSLKYRSSDVPKIHVSSEERADAYTISVRDNESRNRAEISATDFYGLQAAARKGSARNGTWAGSMPEDRRGTRRPDLGGERWQARLRV